MHRELARAGGNVAGSAAEIEDTGAGRNAGSVENRIDHLRCDVPKVDVVASGQPLPTGVLDPPKLCETFLCVRTHRVHRDEPEGPCSGSDCLNWVKPSRDVLGYLGESA
jgi:hypothetical protein